LTFTTVDDINTKARTMGVEMLRANEEEDEVEVANRSCIHVFIFGVLYAYMLSIHCACMYVYA
jgi:hypothetical protein